MPTETETLLLAVLSQLPTKKLKYDLLATSIGSPTPGAARKRWERFQKKLRDSASQQTPTVGQTSPSPPAGRKSTKGKRAGEKPVGVVKAPVDGVGSGYENRKTHGEIQDESEKRGARAVPYATPERAVQLVSPPRRARCAVFREDSLSEEVDEGDEEVSDTEQSKEAVVKEEV